MYNIYFHEWPLVLFTILAQIASGLSLTFRLYYENNRSKISLPLMQKISLYLGGLMAIALICSFFHLSNVFAGYNTLFRLGGNWLPREVFFFGLFVFSCAVLFVTIWQKKANEKIIYIIVTLLPILALLGLISMAGIYGAMSNTVVSWNFGYAFVMFIAVSLMLGGLAFSFIPLEDGGQFILSYKIASLGLLIFILVLPLYMIFLGKSTPTNLNNIFELAPLYSVFMVIGLIFTVVGFGMVFFGKSVNKRNFIIIFVLVLIGQLIIRTLFYSLINTHIM